ncbi:MAG: restriction endonuclease [Candidatus Rokuibacteriota bacterium]
MSGAPPRPRFAHDQIVGYALPLPTLEAAHQKMRAGLASELLNRVKAASPQFFENLVVELLVKMGYGGSRRDAGQAIGRSGDEGIDGVISEDRLVRDVVNLQAKKWDGTVGRPEIQRFVGALHGKCAKKGVFITTSTFSAEAPPMSTTSIRRSFSSTAVG